MGLVSQMRLALLLSILQVYCALGEYSFFLQLFMDVIFIQSARIGRTKTLQLLDMFLCFILLL